MLTTRDIQVVRYLEDGLLLSADIASRLIFHTPNKKSSLVIAQRRLNELYKEKEVKRMRDSATNSFVYYIGKTPTKTMHKLKIADFISRVATSGFEILDYQLEYSQLQDNYHIRPDLLLTVSYHGTKVVFLVEVDITKPFSNLDAYTKLIKDKRNGVALPLPDLPLLIVSVSDSPIKVEAGSIRPTQIKTDFSNLESQIKKPFIQK